MSIFIKLPALEKNRINAKTLEKLMEIMDASLGKASIEITRLLIHEFKNEVKESMATIYQKDQLIQELTKKLEYEQRRND